MNAPIVQSLTHNVPWLPSFHLLQNTHDNTMDSLVVYFRLVWKDKTLKNSDHVYELVGKVSEFWKNFLVPFNPSFLPNRRHLVHNLSSHKQSQKQLPSFSKILGGHTYKGGEKAPLLALWKILHHFFPTFCEVIGVPCCCGQCLKYP